MPKTWPQTALLLGVAALLVTVSCTDWWGPQPRHLLLISLDTVRADRLGSYGYAAAETPHLDALAARGLRFEQATTVVPLTLPAHASLMTGTYPAYHGVRDNGGFYLGEDQETLAEVLRGTGYRTGGFVGAFVLDSRWGIAQGFEEFFDDFDLTEFDEAPGMDAIQRPGSVVVDRALAWLRQDREQPFFAWVHLYDPHTPYDAPEPYRSRFPATRSGAYDAEIAATDALVGRLLEELESDGRLEETLVCVLGDHGELLGEHREMTHGFFLYDGAVRIPLILAGPGLQAAAIPHQVRIVDVLPTLLARLRVEAPAVVQGVDLEPLLRGEDLDLLAYSESWYPRYHYGWSELLSVQDGRYKLIRAPRRELYDLRQDPGELRNLAQDEANRGAGDRIKALERALERWRQEVANPVAASGRQPAPLDPDTEARLKALGYLGAGPSRRHLEDDRPRGDPKDKIGLYNLMKESTAAAAQGEVESAVAKIRQALAEDPEIVEAHMLLGNFHRQVQRFDEAIAAYKEALDLDPEHQEAVYSLALAFKDTGRLGDARAGLERATALDPRNGKVLWQLADVLMRQGHLEEAEAQLLAALDLDLDQARFLLKLGNCYLEMGRLGEAQERLSQALAQNPSLKRAHFALGLVEEGRGRPDEAMAAYRRELEIHPEAYRASFNLARLLHESRRPQDAIPYYHKSLEVQPQFGTGHLYLAKALLDVGSLEAAEEAARRGLEHQPEPRIAPLGHYVLADIYNRQGRFEEATRQEAAARRLELAR